MKPQDWITLISAIVLVMVSLSWWTDHLKFESEIKHKEAEIEDLEEFVSKGPRFTSCDGQTLCLLAGVSEEMCLAMLPACAQKTSEEQE